MDPTLYVCSPRRSLCVSNPTPTLAGADFGCGQHASTHLDLHVKSAAERAAVEERLGKQCHVADPDMEASVREFEDLLEGSGRGDAETGPPGPRSRRQSWFGSPPGWLTRYNNFDDQMSW